MKVDILGEDLKDGEGLMVRLKPKKEREEEEDKRFVCDIVQPHIILA